MDYIKPLDIRRIDLSTFNKDEEVALDDAPLTESQSIYYTHLTQNALGIDDTEPLTTFGDVEGARDYVYNLERQRRLQDSKDVIATLVEEGLITPRESFRMLQESPLPYETTLERMQAEQAIDEAAAEDTNRFNYMLENFEGSEEQKRMLTNIAILQSVGEKIHAYNEGNPDKSWLERKVPYAISGLLPGIDMLRSKDASMYNEWAPFTYHADNAAETLRRIKELSPEEMEAWANGLAYDMLFNKKMNGLYVEEIWNKMMSPSNENFVSVAFDAIDVGTVAKGAAIGGKAAKGTLTETVKGAAKGAIKAIPETVFGLPTAGRLTKKVTGKVTGKIRNLALDSVGKKILSGNFQGAIKSVAEDLKRGAANIEDAAIAGERIFTDVIDPAFKVTENFVPQVGRAAQIKTTEELYEAESLLLKDLAQNLQIPKYSKEISEDLWEGSLYPETIKASNLTQISDFQPIVTNRNNVKGRVIIGNKVGEPFASKKEAMNALKRWQGNGPTEGLKAVPYEATKGSWFIEAEVDFNQSLGQVFQKFGGEGGQISPKFLLGTRNSLPKRMERLRQLAQHDSDYIRLALTPYYKTYMNLSKAEQGIVETLKEMSDRIWFTPEYLAQAGFSERVINGYVAARMIEDMGYAITAFKNAKELGLKGYMRIVTDPSKPPITGKVIDPNSAVYEGKWFIMQGSEEPLKLTKEDFTKGKYKEYAIIEPLHRIGNYPADKVYLIAPKNAVLKYPLDKFFGSYIPGFRHWYTEDAFFVKQPILTRLPNGRRAVLEIATLRGSTSLEAAQGWAKEVEDIRSLVADFLAKPHKGKQIKGKLALDNIIRDMPGKYVSFNSTDEFVNFAKENGISLDPKASLGVLKEGEETKAFANKLAGIVDDEDIKNFEKFVKRNSYSNSAAIDRLERGQGVKDIITDSHVPWMDLNSELKRVIQNIERNGAMEDYTRMFANDWAETFANIIPADVDPVKALSEGIFKPGANSVEVFRAKYAKNVHDFIRGVPNSLDRAVESYLENMLIKAGANHEWLKGIPIFGNMFKEGSRTFNMVTKLTPLNLLTTWTVHSYLGFCNIRQAITQSIAVLNTMSISPVAGGRALPYALVMPALLFKYDRKALELAGKMIKNADATADVSKLKQLIANVKFLTAQSKAFAGGALNGINTSGFLSHVSLWFFNVFESVNRQHSAITALMEKGLEWKNVSKLSAKEVGDLIIRMNDLYMNMGKTGVAIAQMSKLGKVFLQMKGFKLRFLEALTNKELTPWERRRLLAFNLLATGIKGTVGGTVAYGVYDWMTEKLGVPDEVALAIQEGGLNTLSRQLSDHPIDFADTLSPEAGTIIGDVFEAATSGPLQFIAGSTAAGKTWRSIATAANVFSAWVNQKASFPLLRTTFELLAAQKSLPSGLNNAATAFHIATAGRQMSASGYLIGRDLDNYSAVAALFGLHSLTERDYYEMVMRTADEKYKEENAYKDLEPVMGKLVEDPNSTFNIQFFEDYLAIVSNHYKLSDEARQRVWQRLLKSAMDRDTEFAAKIGAGLIKYKGAERTEQMKKARGY